MQDDVQSPEGVAAGSLRGDGEDLLGAGVRDVAGPGGVDVREPVQQALRGRAFRQNPFLGIGTLT